ncbi:YihY/virulence factor BrkB family protein [Halorussus halophilus]|uniref:YihY/virulence factor BrkB family protein n=1 Tax=Halorussus halophilus TaxID=2650975 RepID=UPI001300F4A2|nr:YihY/virulence factor BrkB family protein [Halorussus halophilus]
MSSRFGSAVGVARSVVTEIREQEITFLAASIAYYAFVSLIPLLLLAFAVASFVGGDAFATDVVEAASGILTATALEGFEDFITTSQGRGTATVVSLLTLTWSSLKVFRGLDSAFSEIYATPGGTGFVDQIQDGLTVLVALGVGIGAFVLTSAAVTAFPNVPLIDLLTTLVLVAALVPIFLPLYVVFPDAGVTVREALPGAVTAAVGWTVLQVLFGFYAQVAGSNAYGFLAGALLLVTWFYFGSTIVLLGGVVNTVLTNTGSYAERTTEPDETRAERRRELLSQLMTDEDDSAPDIVELRDELRELQADVESFEEDIEERTVEKPELESELKGYVRKRMRRGHARGWGPYLVLLYGTVMTVAAFFWLQNWTAVFAMAVIWLSTLGLYTLMLLFGFGISAVSVPGRIADRISNLRS